jgi:hypothetical protein
VISAAQLALLYVAPAVLLALALLAGRYPGERLIARLARRRRPVRPRRRAERLPRAPARVVEAELAWALAGRAPPA